MGQGSIINMTWTLSKIQRATLDYSKIDMEFAKIATGDISFFEIRHATLGSSPRAPLLSGNGGELLTTTRRS